MKNRIFIILLLVFFAIQVQAQNAKTHFNTGEDFLANKKYDDAIKQFAKAIEIEPDFAKAYMERAFAYEKINLIEEAVLDYDRATVFLQKKFDPFYNAARLYFKLEKYDDALAKVNKALQIKRRSLEAKALKAKILTRLGNYKQAKPLSIDVIEEMPTAENLYFQGEILKNLDDIQEAESSYIQAYTVDPTYMDAYISLAIMRLSKGYYEAAINTCDQAIKIDPGNIEIILLKSKSLSEINKYKQAIAILTKALLIHEKNIRLLLSRGLCYSSNNQYNEAIADFTTILDSLPENNKALLERALAFEKTGNIKGAVGDYNNFITTNKNNKTLTEEISQIKKQLFELKREQNKPVIQLTDPNPKNDLVIKLPKSKTEISLKGYVTDENSLEYIKINGKEVPFVKENNNYSFLTSINVEGNELITITASDIYQNVQISNYSINWTEINPPQIEIIAPYAAEDGIIMLDHNKPILYVEGKITDESLIQTILVDGVSANFRAEEYNPSFSATINISEKNNFAVRAIDINGNEIINEFTFKRLNEDVMQNNPMGKTWAILIENSKYQYLPGMQGITEATDSLRTALDKYEIHNFIQKKDMTKQEMEKFFSIELRDLVRSNEVNSLLIWYSGHGDLIDDTGYWLPTDAVQEQVFSFYNTNALRASLQSYTKYVTHILVITDACDHGSSFYQEKNNTKPKAYKCGDWKAAKFASAQIVTKSNGEFPIIPAELSLQFTKILSDNTTSCIPIDEIISKIPNMFDENLESQLKFRKIAGLADEGGTFFFISR